MFPSAAQDYLFAGIYAPSNTAIRYSGVWTVQNNTSVGLKTAYLTAEQYASFEFMFYGTSFSFLSRSNTGWSDAQICIDLTCNTQSLAGANTAATYTSSTGSLGWHTGRVRLDGTASATNLYLYYLTIISTSATVPVAVTNFPTAIPVQSVSVTNIPSVSITNIPSVRVTNVPSVSVTNMPTLQAVEVENFPGDEYFSSGYYNDTDDRITYSGSFTQSGSLISSYGTYHRLNTVSSSATFYVFADHITLYLLSALDPQSVRVCIDLSCEDYFIPDMYTPTFEPLEILLPNYGFHTIVLSRIDATTNLIFDGVLVQESAVNGVNTTWMVGENNPQAVQFNYSLTAGDVLSGVLSVGTFFLILLGLLFWYWRTKDA